MNPPDHDELLVILKRILPGTDCVDPADIHALPGGGNNRLFKVKLPGGSVVLKRYFRHPGDQRDRLDNEYRFSRFLWERGLRCIPEPLARCDESGTGLYRYVEGTAIAAASVTERHIFEAQSFLNRANRWRRDPEAIALPEASEACFTIRQHLELIERRIERLLAIPQSDEIHLEAAGFVRNELMPLWNNVRRECLRRVGMEKLLLPDEPLPLVDRILSPSDFGFHNALQTEQGLVFHDFEYSGWDDPAKAVCDFFCQIAVPVPIRYWEEVSEGAAGLTGSPEITLLRMQSLLPVYQIKWVCIALNHFLAVDGERRRFAKGDTEMHLASQMELAGRLLSSIEF